MIASARSAAVTAAALLALHAVPATAAKYSFTHLIVPNENGEATVSGIYQDQAIGGAKLMDGSSIGYVWSAGNYIAVPAATSLQYISDNGLAVGFALADPTTSYTTYNVTTGATNTASFGPSPSTQFWLGGINSAGSVIATQVTVTEHKHRYYAECRPFVQDAGGSYIWLAKAKKPGQDSSVAVGVFDNNTAIWATISCGSGADPSAYILDKNGRKQTFTIPHSKNVTITFVSGDNFGGYYDDTISKNLVGFTSKGGKVTFYTGPPGALYVGVTGTGANGEVTGFYDWGGFVYRRGTYYTVNYPHSKTTMITGISSTGAIIGYYGPKLGYTPTEPFIATCASDKGCTK